MKYFNSFFDLLTNKVFKYSIYVCRFIERALLTHLPLYTFYHTGKLHLLHTSYGSSIMVAQTTAFSFVDGRPQIIKKYIGSKLIFLDPLFHTMQHLVSCLHVNEAGN